MASSAHSRSRPSRGIPSGASSPGPYVRRRRRSDETTAASSERRRSRPSDSRGIPSGASSPGPSGVGGAALGSAVSRAPRSSSATVPPSVSLSAMRSDKEYPHFTVKSKLQDDSSADDLRNWVVAVAYGKFVHVNPGVGSATREFVTPALDRASDVWLTPTFVRLHPELAEITRAIAKSSTRSKWRVWTSAPSGGASSRYAQIDSSANFARWLRSMMTKVGR